LELSGVKFEDDEKEEKADAQECRDLLDYYS
jgi:hypothetical protein